MGRLGQRIVGMGKGLEIWVGPGWGFGLRIWTRGAWVRAGGGKGRRPRESWDQVRQN